MVSGKLKNNFEKQQTFNSMTSWIFTKSNILCLIKHEQTL
jgi:hypothetical protein